MIEILNNAIKNRNYSKLDNNDSIFPNDLTGKYVRNIINNICSNNNIKYLEIGLYRGGTFSAALFNNRIEAVGIDNWSQNWQNDDPKEFFFNRLSKIIGENNVEIIESDCWVDNLLKDKKYNVFTFDGPHSYDDQYNALVKYQNNLEDIFIYIVDDYDNNKSPHVVEAVQKSILDLGLTKLYENYFGSSEGFHEGVYLCCLEKNK